jgi:hypothetical protein
MNDGIYTGEWNKGIRHGRGRIRRKDGSLYEG